jgi:hypothetical protein
MRAHNFGWMAYWDLEPRMVIFKVNVGLIPVQFIRLTWEQCWPCPVVACYTVAQKKKKNIGQGSRKVPVGTIQCVDMAAF